MPNTLGTLSGTLIVQEALNLVFAKRPMLKNITTDMKAAGVKLNQTVQSRIISLPTVNDFKTGASGFVTTDVPVTMDQFKEVHLKFGASEYNATDRDFIKEAAEPMAIAVANSLVDSFASLWTIANFPNSTTIATAAVNYSAVTALREALVTRGADFNRFMVSCVPVYSKLLNDPIIIASLNNADSGGAIKSGILPGVAGFDAIMEYPGLPSTGNMTAFAGTKDTTLLVTRVPADPGEVLGGVSFPGKIEVVTAADSGFSVMLNQWVDPATLDVNFRLVWMYGKALGNANNGQILKSA